MTGATIGGATTGRSPTVLYRLLAVAFALLGGLFGVLGAFVQELQAGGGYVLLFAAGPFIEEGLKPTGVYILLARWPSIRWEQPFVALLAAIAGLTFGLIESALYVALFASELNDWFVIYRWTVPISMHVLASALAGFGVTPELIAWANGEGRFPGRTRNLFAAAVAFHALYNVLAFSLERSGVLDFG